MRSTQGNKMRELLDEEYRLKKTLPKKSNLPWITRQFRRITRPNTITHMGITLCVDKQLLSKKEIRGLYKGKHEKAETLILRTIIEPTDRIVEIGAGFGMTGILCAQIVGHNNIVCFEANEELAPIIEKNSRLNNVALNVVFSPVTSHGKTCEFYRTSTFIGSGTTKTDATLTTQKRESVALHDILDQYHPNTLIVDIEGGESDLLLAPIDGVEKIIVEIHPHKTSNASLNKMLASLMQQGFVQIHELTMENSLCFCRKTSEACAS